MNLAALAADIHRDAAILRTYQALGGNIAATAREHGVTEYRVLQIVKPESIEAAKRRVALDKVGTEWIGCICEVGHTQQGRMYCAMECDGLGCKDHATAERLEAAKAYTAQRRRNNRQATREERRYRPKRASEENVNSERRSIG